MDWGSRFLSFREGPSSFSAAASPNRPSQNPWAGSSKDYTVYQPPPQPLPDFHRPDKNKGRKGAKGDGKGKDDFSSGAKRFAQSKNITVGYKEVPVSDRFYNDILVEAKQSKPNIDKIKRFHPEEAKIFFAAACPNCFVGGKGFKEHNIGTCAKSGEKCNLICIQCFKANHWVRACRQKEVTFPDKRMPMQAEHIGTEWAP